MTTGTGTGTRTPTWRERENNKRRERRRRAIAAKIFAGLRMYGNYPLPKHCDNNEVLKAVCAEAGWTVELDGTTFRKGCKPAREAKEVAGGSASPSPCASSYNPSPASSSFPSPASSAYLINGTTTTTNDGPEGNSFVVPWLKSLNQQLLIRSGGCISAPVTPPLSSPTARTPRLRMSAQQSPWSVSNYASLPSSTPSSPGRSKVPGSSWLMGIPSLMSSGGPASPTFSLVSPNPFGLFRESSGAGSRVVTPGQSGTCSPAAQFNPMLISSDDFAFRNGDMNRGSRGASVVKPWEGETIHEECGSDDLELTLGNSMTRTAAAVVGGGGA